MDIVKSAMRRPVTIFVFILGIVGAAVGALKRIPMDIFPSLDVPVIFVAQPYDGLNAAQIEAYLSHHYETRFTYVTGIEHIESKSTANMAMYKLQFHPGADMALALAETSDQVNRVLKFMPRGVVPPYIVRYDAGSVPVGALVFSSETKGQNELQELARERVRPLFATLPGIQAPPPMGGGERTIVISLNPERLRAFNMSPDEVVDALGKTNIVSPAGEARIGPMMPTVSVNSVVDRIDELKNAPIRVGSSRTVYIKDVGDVEDSAPKDTGYALVGGRRSVFMPVVKRADASTLAVVDEVKRNLPRFQAVLPEDTKISYEFDQSFYVKRSIVNLAFEGLAGAVLTGVVVLLFLRDLRSAWIVVVTIPISLLAALTALWVAGQTINLMTLGGLALSVGVLVDESTVVIENIHAHCARGKSVPRAALDATRETLIPTLLSVLCILAVFTPAFFMTGATRSLFVPLSLSVGFSMIASYFLSSTLAPILAARFVRPSVHAHDYKSQFTFAAFQSRYAALIRMLLRHRVVIVGGYVAAAMLVVIFVGRRVGTEIFPPSDEGQFQIRYRIAPGSTIVETEKAAQRILELIGKEVGEEKIETTMGYVGTHPSSHPINAVYLWMSGSEEGVLQVQLKPDCKVRIPELKERLRQVLSAESPDLDLSFQPSDIVSRVLSFGSPTPVQVSVQGFDLEKDRDVADRIREELSRIPTLRDVRIEQRPDSPTIDVTVDRERAGALGLTVKDVGDSMISATSSSRYVARNFWADSETGNSYLVQVEFPEKEMASLEDVRNVPVERNGKKPLLLRNLAEVKEGKMVGEYDHLNARRMVTVNANIVGEDLGSATRRITEAIKRMGDPPRGMSVALGGQAATLKEMFGSLSTGFIVTVVAVFLLLAANFQSWRLSFAVVSTTPAVVAGIMLMLWLTKTTLNLQSFIGGIMAIGVAVANAILLITFAERNRVNGMAVTEAAAEGASSRLRAIIMTSLAMMAGMIPMALGLSEGGEQAAPLGRAVVGGLAAATVATLLILPSVFALVQGRGALKHVSMDPDDEFSRYYDRPKDEKNGGPAPLPDSHS